jgi:hypothetical protein
VSAASIARAPLRRDPWTWVFVAMLVVAVPILVHEGRDQSFYLDEFDFLARRDLTEPTTILAPWWGHLVALPAIAYRVLFAVWGVRTYLPYQLLAIAGHLSVVGVVWATGTRLGARRAVATLGIVPLLLLGSGRPNILLGFQVTLTAAFALGLAQLHLALHDRPGLRRDLLGLACGAAAVLCSGVGLATTFGVGCAVLVHRGWRLALLHVAPLAVAYLAWTVWAPEEPYVRGPALDGAAPGFAWDMVTTGLRGLGASAVAAAAVAALAAIGAVGTVRGPRADRTRAALVLGVLASGLAFVAATTLTRAGVVLHGGPGEQRYVYLVVAFVLPAVFAGIEELLERSRILGIVAFVPLFAGLPANVAALDEQVPSDVLAPLLRSEHLAAADPARRIPLLLGLPIGVLQEAAPDGLGPTETSVSAEQLAADLFLAVTQEPGPPADPACPIRAVTTTATSPGEPIGIVGDVRVRAFDGDVRSPFQVFSAGAGAQLVPTGELDVIIEGTSPGAGVLTC